MRKHVTSRLHEPPFAAPPLDWLDLASLAAVEVTSEHPDHPVEHALTSDGSGEWRAAAPGVQTIRLLFDKPQAVQRLRLHFEEFTAARTQEFVLRYWRDREQSVREVVRQQWNFSPNGATQEVENYGVALTSVTVLELCITPDINSGNAVASLKEFRVA